VRETVLPYDAPEKRASYEDVVLKHTLEQAINHLNPSVPATARQEALKTVLSL
jgi:hypothetical protein